MSTFFFYIFTGQPRSSNLLTLRDSNERPNSGTLGHFISWFQNTSDGGGLERGLSENNHSCNHHEVIFVNRKGENFFFKLLFKVYMKHP